MRKVLITILLLALLTIFGVVVVSGLTIGNLAIGHSVQAIINKNAELDDNISTLGDRINREYAQAKSNLETSFSKLQREKQTYLDTIAYTTQEQIEAASQTEQYKLDYLWTTIGLYATNNNVVMKAELSYGSSGVPNQYNISFTATGEYLSISDFVYDIEKDPSLGFRIEEFALVPYSENSLQATFIVKNIAIDADSLSKTASVGSGTTGSDTNKADTNTVSGS